MDIKQRIRDEWRHRRGGPACGALPGEDDEGVPVPKELGFDLRRYERELERMKRESTTLSIGWGTEITIEDVEKIIEIKEEKLRRLRLPREERK